MGTLVPENSREWNKLLPSVEEGVVDMRVLGCAQCTRSRAVVDRDAIGNLDLIAGAPVIDSLL